MKKLDPRLRYLMQQQASSVSELSERIGFPQMAEQAARVEVLVRCLGDKGAEDLRLAGMNVRSIVQGFYTVVSGEVTFK